MEAIVVGAGGASRELLRRLGEIRDITVVDTSAERLAAAEHLRSFDGVVGDGSSRVVLQRAGLARACALVAATGDDDTNLEICRLGLDAGLARIVAVAAVPERAGDYRELGVAAVDPDGLAARRVELGLESRRLSSTPVAGGRAEAIEFRIAHDSPARGKPLHSLPPGNWIVGAVLRGDELFIPHGETVLEADDCVTVVGIGADFAGIVRTFTSGEGRFPLEYGNRVAAVLASEADLTTTLPEAIHLTRNSRASSLVLFHADPDGLRDGAHGELLRDLVRRAEASADVELHSRPVRGRMFDRLAERAVDEGVGVVVVGAPSGGGPLPWWSTRRAAALVRRARRPVLLSRGGGPYQRIAAPARQTDAGRAAVRAAIDLARYNSARLQGIAVIDPAFIAGDDAVDEARSAFDWLQEEAAVHSVNVSGTIQRGNPVHALLAAGAKADLFVLSLAEDAGDHFLGRDVGRMVARRATQSVLLLPDSA